MAEGRAVKGHSHRYQQIYDTGDSSDGSSCLTRKSYSPTSKTPVQTCMSPNENLVSSHHEVNEVIEEEQPEGDVYNPALRGGIVRLEENEEYPIKRHCFRDCTKKIFRNRKKCAIIPFVLAFVFMVIFIMCILRITEMYWYYHFDDGNYTKELFIPVGSVVDVNLTSLNISAKHANKLKVTLPNKSSPVRVTTAHEDHEISLSLNMNITLNYENYGNDGCGTIIRYWKFREHITGDITLLGYQHSDDPVYVNICYKWGNITNPPSYCNCNVDGCIPSYTFNISECFDDDRGNDKYVIYIQFCLVGADTATISININETYAIPNKTSYKSIYNDDTVNQNSAVLQFPSLLSELHNATKLYVNTHYKNANDDCSEMIKLDLKPQSKEDAMEIIETVVLVITAILSLLLSLMMFGIGIRCCCCHIKTGFCALGLFYEEQ